MSAHVEPRPKLLLLLHPPAHASGEICWSPKQTRLAPPVPIVLSVHTTVVWTRVCAFLHVPSMRPWLSYSCLHHQQMLPYLTSSTSDTVHFHQKTQVPSRNIVKTDHVLLYAGAP